MQPAARPSAILVCPLHGVAPVAATPGATSVLVNGEPLVLLADITSCGSVVAQGASTVLGAQLPAAHLLHAIVDSSVITAGCSPDVFIGGPTFELPTNFKIEGGAAFQNKLLRDLYFLSQTEQGAKVIDRLANSGKTVTFRDFADRPWYFDHKNTSFVPTDREACSTPTDVVVFYEADPASRIVMTEHATTTTSPQVNLFHEMVHGMHIAEGNAIAPERIIPGSDGPPLYEPYETEEARAIGDASVGWGHADPSENALRDELGMERRQGHSTQSIPHADHIPGPTDHRPGPSP